MAITTDQAMVQFFQFASALITDVMVTNPSATPVAASLGVYTGAAKSGSGIVTSGVLTALTGPTLAFDAVLGARRIVGAAAFVSNAVANGTALTADVYILGIPLS